MVIVLYYDDFCIRVCHYLANTHWQMRNIQISVLLTLIHTSKVSLTLLNTSNSRFKVQSKNNNSRKKSKYRQKLSSSNCFLFLAVISTQRLPQGSLLLYIQCSFQFDFLHQDRLLVFLILKWLLHSS